MSPANEVFIHEGGDSLLAFALRDFRGQDRILAPLETTWMFGSPLLGPHGVELLADTYADIFSQDGAEQVINGLIVSAIPDAGHQRSQLIRQILNRSDAWVIAEDELCSASLDGGLDGFLSRRSASFRRGLGKQSRKAARVAVTFERCAPLTDVDASAVYQRMIDVELRSWKGIGECGMAEPEVRSFYGCLVRRLALTGNARIIFARHEGRDIGYIYGGLAGDCYRGQQFSFDNEWRAYSIGNLMQQEKIRWLCDSGIARYDMGPMMGYKADWTELRTSVESWLIKPN